MVFGAYWPAGIVPGRSQLRSCFDSPEPRVRPTLTARFRAGCGVAIEFAQSFCGV